MKLRALAVAFAAIRNQTRAASASAFSTISTKDELFQSLPHQVAKYVSAKVDLCQPRQIRICDGSEEERQFLMNMMEQEGVVKRLPKYDNWSVFVCFKKRIGRKRAIIH